MKIYFVASNDLFIKQIIRNLESIGIDTVTTNRFDKQIAGYSDVIWCEWADENAIEVSRYVTKAKKILRVHSYEAFTDIWGIVNPDSFDSVIFVSEHIRKEVERRIGREISNAIIISNYLDIDKYYSKEKTGNKIAYAGYICRKKGIGELLMIAQEFSNYEFYIAGTIQDADIGYWFGKNKPSNLHLMEWTDDIAGFYSDKDYVLNTSLRESFSVSTVEAMLCGCKPIVRNWDGAGDLYPQVCIWENMSDILDTLTDGREIDYREFAINKLSLDKVMDKIIDVIDSPVVIDNSKPSVTVAIVQTRKKYMGELLNSLRNQDYPISIKILDNMDKSKSIGRCFNELADLCDTEWIFYLGDDDWLAEDYIESVMKAYLRRQSMYKIEGIMTATTAFDDSGTFKVIPHYATGFWKTETIRKHRFNETLKRQVDTEFHNRMKDVSGLTLLWATWLTGYHYRQHEDNISGNKFTEGAKHGQED